MLSSIFHQRYGIFLFLSFSMLVLRVQYQTGNGTTQKSPGSPPPNHTPILPLQAKSQGGVLRLLEGKSEIRLSQGHGMMKKVEEKKNTYSARVSIFHGSTTVLD